MRRSVFWDFLRELGWKDRYMISNLGVHKKLSQKSCERCKFPGSLCRGSRSGAELHFLDEDFGMISKQVTSSMFWENPSFQSLMICCCPSDSELSNQQRAGNIPEMEMMTINCPMVIQVRQNSPLQILYVRPWGVALCSYLLLKAHTL